MDNHLEIHVTIGADEEAFVLETPFQSDEYRFARELLQEWLGVYGIDLGI